MDGLDQESGDSDENEEGGIDAVWDAQIDSRAACGVARQSVCASHTAQVSAINLLYIDVSIIALSFLMMY